MPFEVEVKASLTAENTFSDWIEFRGIGEQNCVIEAGGSFIGTLTAQTRSVNGSIIDLEDFTVPFSRKAESVGSCDFRMGFKTGNFTSGQANVVLRR